MKVSDAPAHQRCQMITPTSVKQSVRNTSASFGSLYALRFPNDHMITPMSVNNSIVNAGLSQMELLGKRLAAVATKFQCVVRWYVRIVIKLCSNFTLCLKMSQRNFVKVQMHTEHGPLFLLCSFHPFIFFLSFGKFVSAAHRGTPPWTPVFLFPFFVFFSFPSMFSSHIFSILPFLLVAVH